MSDDKRCAFLADVIDEFTRKCLVIRIDWKLKSSDVTGVLPDLFLLHWIAALGAKTAFIEPTTPWENGYCESFDSKLRDELLNGESF